MSDSEACYLLASCAAEITKVILGICRSDRKISSSGRRSIAGMIATRLHMIHTYLNSLPPYLVDPDIEKLCLTLLNQLAEICTVSTAPHLLSMSRAS